MIMRICTKCGREFPATPEFFHRQKDGKHGITSRCKQCTNRYGRKWYQSNKEKVKQSNYKWRAKNLGRSQAAGRKWKLKRYRISLAEFDTMMKEQNGVCAICNKPAKVGKSLCVDHDHKTGKIRGLLCQSCNLLIGNAKDDIEVVFKALHYLIVHKKKLSAC